jgi:hypothetical protein
MRKVRLEMNPPRVYHIGKGWPAGFRLEFGIRLENFSITDHTVVRSLGPMPIVFVGEGPIIVNEKVK